VSPYISKSTKEKATRKADFQISSFARKNLKELMMRKSLIIVIKNKGDT
jgi:hypothetical protein